MAATTREGSDPVVSKLAEELILKASIHSAFKGDAQAVLTRAVAKISATNSEGIARQALDHAIKTALQSIEFKHIEIEELERVVEELEKVRGALKPILQLVTFLGTKKPRDKDRR